MGNRSDNFNRANNASSLGSPSDGGSAWVALSGTFGISSNQAYAPLAGGQGLAYVEASATAVQVSATIAAAGTNYRLYARVADTANYLMMAITATQMILYKRVANTLTQLGTVATFTVASGDVVTLEVTSGNAIRGLVNGTQRVGPQTDAAGSSNTKHGLGASTDSTVRFDDFAIVDLAATAQSFAGVLGGVGSAALAVTPTRFGSAVLAGVGSAALAGTIGRPFAAALAGVGSATLAVTPGRTFAAALDGIGTAALAAAITFPAIVDDGDPGYSETDGWDGLSGLVTAYGGDVRYALTGSGSVVATWDTGLASGSYEVFAAWHYQLDGATDAPYRIYDGAALLGTVRVDQSAAASGPSFGGVPFQSLGSWTVGTGPLVVALADDAGGGYVFADAVRVAPGLAQRSFAAAAGGVGSAALAVTPARAFAGALAGVGSAVLAADVLGQRSFAGALAGAGAAALAVTPTRFASAALAGAGTATLAAQVEAAGEQSFRAALGGSGLAALAGTIGRRAAAALVVAGSATLAVVPGRAAAASLGGSGAATLSVRAERFAAAGFAGVGSATLATPEPPALTLREGLLARLRADVPLVALVGTRIRPGPTLDQGLATPALTYEVLSDRKVRQLSGATRYREARLQVGCWGRSVTACVGVLDAVDALLESLTPSGMDCDLGGVVVRWIKHDVEEEEQLPLQDAADAKRWVLPVIYLVNYRES